MASLLVLSVRRREPVLVVPSEPTPHEFKNLSDIDSQERLRMQTPMIQYYRNEPSMRGQDPVKVIKEALSKALVYYYPLAGRLREGPRGKLIVECTSEGVLFVGADADVRLEEFGDRLPPPVPCLEELLFDVPGSAGIIDCPLLLIQVTRLLCGGFIFALRFNHAISDVSGILQFMTALGEIARGATTPTVLPVWERELLDATATPLHATTHAHRVDGDLPHAVGTRTPRTDLVQQSFFFTSKDISVLKNRLPPHLRTSSAFDVLAAFFWRICTAALLVDPDDEVRFVYSANVRLWSKSYLPLGFYGNAVIFPVARSKAGDLRRKPLSYAVELVRRAKSSVTHESLSSMIAAGWPLPRIDMHHGYFVSDVTRLNFGQVDFGWGRAVYGGPAIGGDSTISAVSSIYVSYRNSKGEEGVVVPLSLPRLAMERVVKEVERVVHAPLEKPRKDIPATTRSAL